MVVRDKPELERLVADGVVRLVVALSGGADSVALLHWLVKAQLGVPVVAIHVNHGLQKEAEKWQEFCERFCNMQGVDIESVQVSVERKGSIEENARLARYIAFEEFLGPRDLLLLAHHMDDQLETVLLNLFRGSEVFGVQGMPMKRAIAGVNLYRPLLGTRRHEILSYCRKNKLSWVEDDTNMDLGMDRNFLRHELLPKITTRFPAAEQALINAHERDTQASQLIENIAESDLDSALSDDEGLSLRVIGKLGELRVVNLLREFMRRKQVGFPSGKALRQCVHAMLNSPRDAAPLLAWGGYELRRHGDFIYLLNSMPQMDNSSVFRIYGDESMAVSGGVLSIERIKGQGVTVNSEMGLEGRFRQGGEKIQRQQQRTLKNIFQENQLPSWLRSRVPLIYEAGQLIAVPGIPAWNMSPIEAEDRRAGSQEAGWVFTFEIRDRV